MEFLEAIVQLRDRAAPEVEFAEYIAGAVHALQVDKAGKPYIDHPRRVVANLQSLPEYQVLSRHEQSAAAAAAWLHDVVEDSGTNGFPHVRLSHLFGKGISVEAVDVIKLLTRPEDKSTAAQDAYYQGILNNPLALLVKWADIADNLNEQRLSLLPAELQKKAREKYAHALEVLQMSPAQNHWLVARTLITPKGLEHEPITEKFKLTAGQLDRAIGAILGSATGDALGAPYEFKPAMPADESVEMKGGGTFGWAPGEWTDDTSMQIPILQALARGLDLSDESTLDQIVSDWHAWAKTAPDVGIQTRAVLSSLKEPTARNARASAKAIHLAKNRSGGNGSLMRTASVALATLNDPERTAINARAVSDLTHFDENTGDACVLWTEAIRQAILTGECDIRDTLRMLPIDRRDIWRERIDLAEKFESAMFQNNGWVVSAFQAAWSAVFRAASLPNGLERAIRAGDDTDTVAAIAGGILGAKSGADSIPEEWLAIVHGWPDLTAQDLEVLVRRVEAGQVDDQFDKAYRRLYVSFSANESLDIDTDTYDWSLEQEREFAEQYRSLLKVYGQKPV